MADSSDDVLVAINDTERESLVLDNDVVEESIECF